jgi:hypothetical protein
MCYEADAVGASKLMDVTLLCRRRRSEIIDFSAVLLQNVLVPLL